MPGTAYETTTLRESSLTASLHGMKMRRFSHIGILSWVTLIGLVLAIVIPRYGHLQRRKSGADSVKDAAASADGATFGALMHDGRVIVWNRDGTLRAVLITEGDALALSRDGTFAAVSRNWRSKAGEQIDIWAIDAGKLHHTFPERFKLTSFEFSPSEDLLVVADLGQAVHVCSLDANGDVRTIPIKSTCAAFSPDGKMLAVGTAASEVLLYDVETLELTRSLGGEGTALFSEVTWSPRGQTIVSVSRSREKDVEMIEERDLASDAVRTVRVLDEFSLHGMKASYLPGGRTLAVPDGSLSMTLLDAKTLEAGNLAEIPNQSMAAGLHGDTFITSDSDCVDLWDAQALRVRQRL